MHEPALYKRANKLQRQDAKKIMDEFAGVLKLRSDGRDSLIDIGCGSGDVLMDFVVPILPDTYTQVVGIDISTKMIQFSRQAYAAYGRVDFKVLDIETDEMPLEFYEQFDHVTSFYCLHWVQNQRQALENIYNMLVVGGDCLIVFATSCPLYAVYGTQGTDPKWSGYLKDADKYVPPAQNDPDPWKTYTKLFKDIGFRDYTVEVRHKAFIYEGCECFKDYLMSVNPFVEGMPLRKRQELITEILEIWRQMDLCEEMADKDDYRYIHPYKMAIVYARK